MDTGIMQLDFFNTIHLSGSELSEAKEVCTNQGQRILKLMKPGAEYTPFEVWELYNREHPAVPITSIRRAMTNLTDRGELIMTAEMKDERYGKKNHKWIKFK